MVVRKLGVLGGLTWVASAAACSSDEAAVIVAQRDRFRELVPDQYVIAACGIGLDAGCTREVVIAGRVVTAETTAPNAGAWRPVAELGAWVDQVSSMFEATLADPASLRTLEFEPRWHYVSEYHVAAGDERGRKVTCFLPHRVDLQQCQAQSVALGLP